MKIVQSSRHAVLFLSLLILSLSVSVTSLTAERLKESSNSQFTPGTKVIQSDQHGIRFQLHTESFQIDQEGNIQVAGLQQRVLKDGAPALPYYSTFIALPPEATVSVSVSKASLSQHRTVDVLPAPLQQLQIEADASGMLVADAQTIMELAPQFMPDQSIYGRDAFYPTVDYDISDPQYLRDLRLVELKIYPLRYHPGQRTLVQAQDITVNLVFHGAKLENLDTSQSYMDSQAQSFRGLILNFDQAKSWRMLPQVDNPASTLIDLPIGADTFKILVDQDGIYEVNAGELENAGMTLPVDPQTIELMQGGLPVAYQFIDANNNSQFDEGDKLRFYGWAFDGSRYEKMYIGENVFWLWAGGSASTVPVQQNETGSGNIITSFTDQITRQDENDNFSGWGLVWENEPTTWHWDLIHVPTGVTVSRSYDIELPNPDPAASSNEVTVELTTRSLDPLAFPNQTVKTMVNDDPIFGEYSWIGRLNVNANTSVPGAALKQPGDAGYPANQIKLDLSSDSPVLVSIYLTRITVAYLRQMIAIDDQLIFSAEQAGHHDFHVAGFSGGNADDVVVWDISDRTSPEEIKIQAQDIQGNGTDFTYQIGRSHGQDAEFIATTSQNIRSVKNISYYKPVSLNPPSGKAQWLAISHSSLLSAAETLAQYRSKEYSTWVVSSEDVINQVTYGFNTPQAIKDFLFQSLVNWTVAPQYVTLFGDATRNPLGKDCPLCAAWDKDAKNLLVTDFAFVDRWNGMVPSDFSMSLLIGNDLLPDTTIGRMPANTLAEANAMVQKVIDYENQRADTLESWQRNFLFLADDPDSGGNFCEENIQTGYTIPRGPYNQIHLCLPKSTAEDTEALRLELGKHINDTGLSILNYRGHGSPTAWAGTAGTPKLLTNEDIDFWQNVGRPIIIISADCLDGYFIQTHYSALGETFHSLNNRGSVAHWSSSGLGFSSEHSVLQGHFYEGIFKYRYKQMGDAINLAKVKYYQEGQYPSELYSFILLGDPALEIVPIVESGIFMPFIKARF